MRAWPGWTRSSRVPDYAFAVTDELTNFAMPEAVESVPREPAVPVTAGAEIEE